MRTPICDFVSRYAESSALRLHMPGHKGAGFLGIEQLDITEISGADSLYDATGIIRESEETAGKLFGANTFYSTEGSSQCIRAMLQLSMQYAKRQGRKPVVAALRNVHKTFVSAVALLDIPVVWLYPKTPESYLCCRLSAQEVEQALLQAEQMPTALYLTSPDYLGELADISGISQVCRRHGVLLLVDNAHGAYLRFLQPSRHPIDLGADLCCDSAHKTLPVLTGGAYLHIAKSAPAQLTAQAKNALMLFGSTSPSFLILQSLDHANAYLADGYSEKLEDFCQKLQALKEKLTDYGYRLKGSEPLKLTIHAKPYGYTGIRFAKLLEDQGLVCELCDPDFVVMMMTPETGEDGLRRLEKALLAIPRQPALTETPPDFHRNQAVMSIREAVLAPNRTLPVQDSIGRILGAATVSCPPAVPIVLSGERIDAQAAACFAYYGIETCTVVWGE